MPKVHPLPFVDTHTGPVPKDQLCKTVYDADTWASGPALLSILSVNHIDYTYYLIERYHTTYEEELIIPIEACSPEKAHNSCFSPNLLHARSNKNCEVPKVHPLPFVDTHTEPLPKDLLCKTVYDADTWLRSLSQQPFFLVKEPVTPKPPKAYTTTNPAKL